MEKIKRFIDCYIPTETCNFRCHYCYVTQHRKFNNKIAKFNYDPSYIRKALSRKRLGGICLFNLCAGGETLLSEDVVKITKELLEEGHYVMIVTNGSLTKRFQEISEFGKEQLSRLFFKFSFHYMELKRLNLLNTFFKNVELMEKAGASYTLEITPTDELEPYINEIKEVCMKKNGDEWLKDEMKSFMSNKLNESNEEYSNLKKTKINLRNKPIKVLKSIKRKLVK